MRCALAAVLVLPWLAGCAVPSAVEPEVLLLGEQHDAPEHQQIQREVIHSLAARAKLAAVAIEMAEQGTSTEGLSPTAPDAAVKAALRWDEAAWPWDAYRPAVMAAVGAGVTVLGANLPRSEMRAAMANPQLDTLLPEPAHQAQQQAIRAGHCGLLPEAQIVPMTRIQIARDRAMAQTLAKAAAPGRTVVLLAGAGHADPALGVPRHLPGALRTESRMLPPQPAKKDYCEEFQRQMKPAPP